MIQTLNTEDDTYKICGTTKNQLIMLRFFILEAV